MDIQLNLRRRLSRMVVVVTVLETVYCGRTKKKVPYDDCQEDRLWVKNT